jgi:hypothetical protein
MKGFLEQRRDWQKDMIMQDLEQGVISKHEAEEQLQRVDERYDKARRWRDSVA